VKAELSKFAITDFDELEVILYLRLGTGDRVFHLKATSKAIAII
jgi:hypothetical protein